MGTTAPYATFEVRNNLYKGTPNITSKQISGGILELARGTYPYIDFNGWTLNQDYDARIILRSDDYLSVEGTSLNVGYYQSIGSNKFAVNGNSYFNGNVGIGTTSPAYKLDINGNFRGSKFYDYQNTSYYVDPASTSVMNNINFGYGCYIDADENLFITSGNQPLIIWSGLANTHW